MTDALPSAPKDPAGRLITAALTDLRKTERTQRRLLGRINTLQLLSDINDHDGELRKRSEREWRDHPQVQLLLERRDRYQRMEREIDGYATSIDRFEAEHDPDSKPDARALMVAYTNLAKLRVQQSAELDAMETCLLALRREGSTHTALLSKIVNDLAKLHQTWRIHKDKMGESSVDNIQDAELEG